MRFILDELVSYIAGKSLFIRQQLKLTKNGSFSQRKIWTIEKIHGEGAWKLYFCSMLLSHFLFLTSIKSIFTTQKDICHMEKANREGAL